MKISYPVVTLLFFILSGYSPDAMSQLRNEKSGSTFIQYGAAMQASVTLMNKKPVLKICANAGLGIEIVKYLFPSYNLQVQLFNGGHGTAYVTPDWRRPYIDITHSVTFTIGVEKPGLRMDERDLALRNSPLYYFSDFGYPALQNPYNYSVSFGTNCIRTWGRHHQGRQQAGYFNLHIREFQFAYSNDGTPFNGTILADGEDRYYSGDGFMAVHLPKNYPVNIIRASYHKFTGFSKDAFEVANGLFLGNVDYVDTVQQYFNRSLYSFGAGNAEYGVFAALELRNRFKGDMQHNIHRDGYYAFHQMPYWYSIGVTASYFIALPFQTRKK